MNILDHRILVPKSAPIVWEYLSDLSKNPSWQVNYSSISFLTSRRSGTGVRWRYTTTNSREYVAETTAWYEGLGYEYTLVDGVSFRENKGRIRLQEIPEGTIVQWTFSYDPGGLLGGVRNAVSFKRQLESVMVESLKTLWRVLNQANDGGVREVKSILRAGLDYEARAQYKPRHPSVRAEQPPTQPVVAPVIAEPPLSDEDTRPRAPIMVNKPDEPTAEPAFLGDLPPTISESSSSEPIVGETIHAAAGGTSQPIADEDRMVVLETAPTVTPKIPLADEEDASGDVIKPPGILLDQPVIVDIAPSVTPPVDTTDKSVDAVPHMKLQESDKSAEPDLVLSSLKTDRGELSVFDVFGVPKPSETQEMHAVSLAEDPIKATVQSAAVGQNIIPRAGLRLMLRRRRVRLRRPG